jgi:Zn-dependent protease with chaperone function
MGALVAAWTGLPFALWGMVLFAGFGAVAGLLGASELELGSVLGVELGFGIASGVGVASAILGALIGALSGLLVIYIYLVLHPLVLLGALITGIVLSRIILSLIVATEPVLMRLRGYRELSRREKQLLHPMLEDAGRRMGLPTLPALWISDQQKPGAWAHMRGIVVTRGLLGAYSATESPPLPDLDSAAITAILAHELHHWDSCDVVGSTVVFACFYPVALVVNAISWVGARAQWLAVILWCFFWPFWLSTKLVVVPLMTRRSRRYEYEADARAARLGDDYRLGLRRALDELSAWERPRTGWEDVIAATHPPIERRLQMLEAQPMSALNDTDDRAAPVPRNPRPTPSHPASMSWIERLRQKKASTSKKSEHLWG